MSSSKVTIPRVIRLLPAGERRRLALLFVLLVAAAIGETVGVASIVPFMAVVVDPSSIAASPRLSSMLARAGIVTPRESLIAIGGLVIVVLILGNAAAAAGQWVQQRIMARVRRLLSAELFTGYLRQPYSFHVQHDAAALMKVVLSDVDASIHYLVTPVVAGSARAVVVVGLLALVLVVDPVAAIGTTVVLGLTYLTVYTLLRARQTRLGEQASQASVDRNRAAIEGFGGVKELMVLGREREAARRFQSATSHLSLTQASNTIAGLLPRYLLETIAFGAIVGMTLVLVIRDGTPQTAVSTLALYALVGYRLMPALQQIFSAAVTLRFGGATLDSLETHLRIVRSGGTVEEPEIADLPADADVRFENVTFQYPGAPRPALRNINLTLRRKESVGLVGRTGSGKTTLADMLLGLYQPTSGRVTVGGLPLSPATARAWRRRVGYVPQSVFLANASIAQNIAFGLNPKAIDRGSVEAASRMAQADEFIDALPDGLDTVVGERGVKLSGGQRQRLGIARALYHRPDVLVFDEATSALDGMTEDAVMRAIAELSTDHTVVLIAHRLRTIEACDRIIMLDAGAVVADGTYDELRRTSTHFRRLADARAAAPAGLSQD